MAVDYEILGQVAPTNTTEANLFTSVTGHMYVVSTIVVCNTTTSAATCRIFARMAGATVGVSNAIVYDQSVPANSTVAFTLGVTLNGSNGDVLMVRTGTANALTFTAFGSDTY